MQIAVNAPKGLFSAIGKSLAKRNIDKILIAITDTVAQIVVDNDVYKQIEKITSSLGPENKYMSPLINNSNENIIENIQSVDTIHVKLKNSCMFTSICTNVRNITNEISEIARITTLATKSHIQSAAILSPDLAFFSFPKI